MATPSRPGQVAGLLDGGNEQGEDLFGLVDLGGEAPFVTEAGGEALAREQLAQGRVDLGTGPDGLGHARGAERGDHELLEVELVRRVRTAVYDVEVGYGKPRGHAGGVEAAPQRNTGGQGDRPGGGHRDADDGVGPEARLVLGPVELDHAPGPARRGRRNCDP